METVLLLGIVTMGYKGNLCKSLLIPTLDKKKQFSHKNLNLTKIRHRAIFGVQLYFLAYGAFDLKSGLYLRRL